MCSACLIANGQTLGPWEYTGSHDNAARGGVNAVDRQHVDRRDTRWWADAGVASTPDVVVSYYGSGIADRLDDASRLDCPVIFHFGAADTYLPPDQAERIRASFQDHPDAEIHMHADAGHAFDNFRAPIFYHQSAADEAWPQTRAFLEQHLAPRVPTS